VETPEFNTIDFLVSVKKDSTGKDEVFNVYQEGASNYQNINVDLAVRVR
jgi:putative alpha-1,2-mannosidase